MAGIGGGVGGGGLEYNGLCGSLKGDNTRLLERGRCNPIAALLTDREPRWSAACCCNC